MPWILRDLVGYCWKQNTRHVLFKSFFKFWNCSKHIHMRAHLRDWGEYRSTPTPQQQLTALFSAVFILPAVWCVQPEKLIDQPNLTYSSSCCNFQRITKLFSVWIDTHSTLLAVELPPFHRLYLEQGKRILPLVFASHVVGILYTHTQVLSVATQPRWGFGGRVFLSYAILIIQQTQYLLHTRAVRPAHLLRILLPTPLLLCSAPKTALWLSAASYPLLPAFTGYSPGPAFPLKELVLQLHWMPTDPLLPSGHPLLLPPPLIAHSFAGSHRKICRWVNFSSVPHLCIRRPETPQSH